MNSHNDPSNACLSCRIDCLGYPVVMGTALRVVVSGQDSPRRYENEAGQGSTGGIIKRIFFPIRTRDIANAIWQISDQLIELNFILISCEHLKREVRGKIAFHITTPLVSSDIRWIIVEISKSQSKVCSRTSNILEVRRRMIRLRIVTRSGKAKTCGSLSRRSFVRMID